MQNETIALIYMFLLLTALVLLLFAQNRKIRELEDDNAELKSKYSNLFKIYLRER